METKNNIKYFVYSRAEEFTIHRSSVWKRTNPKLLFSSKANMKLPFSNLVNFGCII